MWVLFLAKGSYILFVQMAYDQGTLLDKLDKPEGIDERAAPLALSFTELLMVRQLVLPCISDRLGSYFYQYVQN